MSQTTEIQIQNQAGLPFRQKMNLMLSALNTCFAGTSEPTVTEAYMNWLDTSVSPNVLKRRNSSDTAFEVHPLQSLADTTKITADAAMPRSGGNFSGAANANKSSDIASAATTNIAAATGEYVVVTGTTTITSLGTAQAGTMREVVFASILTITHNATSLILPTSGNIVTAAGDSAMFRSEGGGNWRCVKYQRADGTPVGNNGANQRMLLTAAVATTSGVLIDFTGIPSWAKAITINFNGISTNGASPVQVQLGHSGGVTTSGYLGSVGAYANGTPSCASLSAGITTETTGAAAAATIRQGVLTLYLSGTSSWAFSSRIGHSNGPTITEASGTITLAGVLDRIRLTTVNGTDAFDAGSASILIEGY